MSWRFASASRHAFIHGGFQVNNRLSLTSARRLLLVGFLALLIQPLQAKDNRYEQRSRYLEALQLLERGQRGRFRELTLSLSGYPLQPYMRYAELMHYRSRLSRNQVEDFRQQFPDTPLADQLLQNYLHQLARRRDWNTFMQLDRPSLPSKILACERPVAYYETGRLQESLHLIDSLWLIGKSQPKECDPAFRLWRKQKRLTEEMAWQRLRLALLQNQYSLAGYVSNFLPPDLQALSAQYSQFMRRPAELERHLSGLRQELARVPAKRAQQLRLTVTDPLYRLARSDASKALHFWQQLNREAFGEEESKAMERHLLLWLLHQGDSEGRAHELNHVVRPGDKEIGEAGIRLALRSNQLERLPSLIEALPEASRKQPRWRYWLARALMGADNSGSLLRGQQLMAELAKERDYYGFLAADLLQVDYVLNDSDPMVSRESVTLTAARPGIARALELFVLGELSSARREWLHANRAAGEDELLTAAVLADEWGWHERAIRTLIAAGKLDHIRVRFPLAYADELTYLARYNDLPTPWAFAIARQESAFMPDVRSSSGALGIMQLMPGTANLVSRSLGIGPPTAGELLVPATNIRLGTSYLGQMLRRFSGNRVLASAAYNAGPRRVERWLESQPPLPLDAWIETIPLSETRQYVQNVLYFSVIYSHRLHRPESLTSSSETAYFTARASQT